MSEREKLAFEDARSLQAILGAPTESKRVISDIARATGVRLHVRGTEVTLEGDDAEQMALVTRFMTESYAMAQNGKPLPRHDCVRAIEYLRSNDESKLSDVFDDVVLAKTQGGRSITPRSLAQKQYIDAMRRQHLIFGVGPAGTGKTYLAVAMAVRRLLDKQIRRIILTRPAIEAGESLGFLPGTFEEKVSPYMRPLYDGLHDMLDPQKVQRLMEHGTIEIAPLAYMRGRTLSDAFVILDEAQNATREQMKMFLTRIGLGTWAVVAGDPSQNDLGRAGQSGLAHALAVLQNVPSISFCRFSDRDVMRHRLVQDIVRAYDQDERRRSGSAANEK